ncbi:hypothetical protein [Mumia zhuanghuii]|uniref:hypothetical protein n=1 Tax=Mumia zhuanghuii TaxID=2585211 RepID=UPI0036446B6E
MTIPNNADTGAFARFLHDLGDELAEMVRFAPRTPVGQLTVDVRRRRPDLTIRDADVLNAVTETLMLVGHPDGTVSHLASVLDGCVFTQRVRATTTERVDVRGGTSLLPIEMIVREEHEHGRPLPVSTSPFGDETLVGPSGWLPTIPPYGLVGLRWTGGAVVAGRVDEPEVSPDHIARISELLADHYRKQEWWGFEERGLDARPADLLRAIAQAKLEDPSLFCDPLPPLAELMYDPLDRDQDRFLWREHAAIRQGENVSFSVQGMPDGLHAELRSRATTYGMSFDQYVIAILGHLAWRTPFAEDLGPVERWWPGESDPFGRR